MGRNLRNVLLAPQVEWTTVCEPGGSVSFILRGPMSALAVVNPLTVVCPICNAGIKELCRDRSVIDPSVVGAIRDTHDYAGLPCNMEPGQRTEYGMWHPARREVADLAVTPPSHHERHEEVGAVLPPLHVPCPTCDAHRLEPCIIDQLPSAIAHPARYDAHLLAVNPTEAAGPRIQDDPSLIVHLAELREDLGKLCTVLAAGLDTLERAERRIAELTGEAREYPSQSEYPGWSETGPGGLARMAATVIGNVTVRLLVRGKGDRWEAKARFPSGGYRYLASTTSEAAAIQAADDWAFGEDCHE